MNRSLLNTTSTREQVLISRFKATARLFGVAVALAGSLVLVGWAFDIVVLKSISPNWVTMKANTALAFILTGVALALQGREHRRRWARIANICAVTAALVGLLTLVEEFSGCSLGIDQLLFLEAADAAWTTHPGRMAPVTALSFLLIGAALLLLPLEVRYRHQPSRWLVLPALVLSLLAVMGYLYGVQWLYGITNYTPMALHTAVLFMGLGAGILFVRPERGVTAVLVSAGPGGIMLRRVLPIALLLPLAGGWVRLQGELAGFYGFEFGLCLTVLMCLVPVSAMMWWTAVLLQRADKVRRQGEDRIRSVASNLPGMVFQFCASDHQWSLRFVSEPSERIYGVPIEPLDTYFERFTAQVASEDRERWFASVRAVVRHTTSWGFEGRFITPAGEEKYIQGLAQPIRLENEVVLNGIILDITDRVWAGQALQREQIFTSALLENVADGVVACDANGILVSFNRTSRQWHGMDAMDLPLEQSIRHYDLYGSDGKTPLTTETSPLMRALRGEVVRDFGMAIMPKDQPPRYVLANGVPFFDAEGKKLGAVVVMHDITERKRAAERLYRLNRELRAISECNQALVKAVDERMLLDAICGIICEVAGYRMAWVGFAEHDAFKTVRPANWSGIEDGFLGQAAITWADVERGRGPTGTCIRSGKACCVQDIANDPRVALWREACLQRGYRSAIALPLLDDNRIAFGALTLCAAEANAFTPEEIRLLEELAADLAFGIMNLRGCVERQRAEVALQERKEQFDLMLQSAMDGFMVVDTQGRLLEVNDAYCRMSGYSRDELLQMSISDLEAAMDLEEVTQNLIELRRKEVSRFESVHRCKDGRLMDIEVSLVCIPTMGGRFFAFVRDITVRKQTEELQRMATEAKEAALRAKDDFLANMSHELRTPLNAIIGFSEGLLARTAIHPLNEHQQQRIGGIRKAGEHLLTLIQGVLDLAKVESGKMEVHVTTFDVREVAHEVGNVAELLLKHKPAVQFALDLEPDLPPIVSDADKVRQILENLVSNAVKFTLQGTVALRIRRRGESLVLEVEDTGVGIPTACLNKVFDKFFQVPNANVQSQKGTGLGLSVCGAYAELLGGKITVQSVEGHGSTFTMTLPLVCP